MGSKRRGRAPRDPDGKPEHAPRDSEAPARGAPTPSNTTLAKALPTQPHHFRLANLAGGVKQLPIMCRRERAATISCASGEWASFIAQTHHGGPTMNTFGRLVLLTLSVCSA